MHLSSAVVGRGPLQPSTSKFSIFDYGQFLGRFVLRNRIWIVLFWFFLAIWGRTYAPSWEEIAYDGDFDYLPDEMPSVSGMRLLDAAFPGERSRSQLLIVLSRDSQSAERYVGSPAEGNVTSISKADEHVGLDLVRRLNHRLAELSIVRADRVGWESNDPEKQALGRPYVERALLALDDAIAADEAYYKYFAEQIATSMVEDTKDGQWPRLAIAYWDRADLQERLGNREEAASDREAALLLEPTLATSALPIGQRDLSAWESLLDNWTWHDPVIGHRLSPRGARMIVLRLSSEFAATSNIRLLSAVEEMIDRVLRSNREFTAPGLSILPTGNAAIGGETLRASADAIRYTEVLTVVLIMLVLAAVYRSPLLVIVPLVSIVVAVVCATALIAVLAKADALPGLSWIDLKVFTTSRIFVVVILFGAGTDYCLFLISRLREEAAHREWGQAVEVTLARVADALVGSALTTVVGLAMLYFSDFGKFHYSGPVIAICLLVALLVCTTFTPALLIAVGPSAFWPGRIPQGLQQVRSPFWHWIAGVMTRRPAIVLAVGMGLLVPPSIYGFIRETDVTYDISSELGSNAISLQGLQVLKRHAMLADTNPMTLMVVRPIASSRDLLQAQLAGLVDGLYALPGVIAVRSALDPLGDYPPGEKMGLFDRNAWRRRALQSHRISQQYFWSEVPDYQERLVRLDIVLSGDPFQRSSEEGVKRITHFMDQMVASGNTPWFESTYAVAGMIPSIMDLRQVTMRDSQQIKFFVVAAVFLVLLGVIRRVGLSLYMVFTVLLSYFATLGLTILFFRVLYGDTFVGLDWKVPIFLFVILVAVGQDYNVYLVTRILEERRVSHPLAAVRRAVARTGGIITSCGIVMALTFFSMTASAWVPGVLSFLGWESAERTGSLRGVTELGFALGLGVLLDTFYVRTVLVPAYCVLGSHRVESEDGSGIAEIDRQE